jgi:L-ascorbate metabolism protein UlaG (beta-lactamase superfamily)
MEITWFGHSCFRLSEKGLATVVTDPYDHTLAGYEPLKLRSDIVTISHESPGHNYIDGVKGASHTLRGPGEFEIGGVFITGIQTNHRNGKEDSLRNTLFVFEYNGLNIAHLGDLNHIPSQAEVEDLGTVHIALVPVGDGSSLNAAKAAEVISLFEPKLVIPMHYATPDSLIKLDPLSKFLKEMGLNEEAEKLPSLKISGTSGLGEETRVITLDYQHA